jgi:hypothetical protein
MTQTTRPESSASIPQQASRQNVQATEMTGWVGWIGFASIMMMMLGTFHVFEGFVALFQQEYFQVGKSGLSIHVNYSAWGWVHIIGGVLIVAAGVALFAGKMWARVIAVALAFVSALLNVAFLAADPVWSVLLITIDILVIWAVTVHGSELKN